MMVRRARFAMLTATALAAGLAAVSVRGTTSAAAAPAAASACVPTQIDHYTPADLNADAVSDLVVGVPGATVAGQAGAGAVDIRYRTAPGPVQRIDENTFSTLLTPRAGDHFGASIAVTNLMSDGDADYPACSDLVIGVPGANAVIIAHGSNDGVTAAGAIIARTPGAGGARGAAVAADGNDIFVAGGESILYGVPGANYRGVAGSGEALGVPHSTAGTPTAYGDSAGPTTHGDSAGPTTDGGYGAVLPDIVSGGMSVT